ncbi:hypothetical protein G3M48_001525, partial [Beauveria asiatica]
QMIEDVCEKLVDAVRVRLRADVPMGLLLSGASYIAARTVKWLSERFGLRVECHMLEIDEQKLADNFEDSVYHTEHHIFYLNTTAKSVLSSLPREHGIRSVLSREGSDEHFAGYSYFTADFLQ